MHLENLTFLRKVKGSRQLVSPEILRREEDLLMRTRIVEGSFLKGVLPTSAFNVLYRSYQLQMWK